jgi:hypothetical protein
MIVLAVILAFFGGVAVGIFAGSLGVQQLCRGCASIPVSCQLGRHSWKVTWSIITLRGGARSVHEECSNCPASRTQMRAI